MEKVIIPKVLAQFSQGLTEKQKPYISINAAPLECDLDKDPLELQQSKFLGKPFIPEGMEYPKDKSGNPMVLVAQINFSELPHLDGFPTSGILQLYFSTTEWWDMPGTEKIVYITEENLNKSQSNACPTLDIKSYEELPIWKIHKLDFKKALDTGSSEDCQFSFDFGGKDYWDFEETLTEEEKESFNEYFTSEGHKIGGYGFFTQGDPRDYSADQATDIQLLQLDTDDEIMFGDSGVGHLFISPENLANGELEKAYFYWDCC